MGVANAEYCNVRPFNVNDPQERDRVLSIAQNSLTEHYSEKLIIELYENWPDGFSVADSNGKIIGFLAGSRYSSSESRVLMLAVEKDYRDMGIGSRLLSEFIHMCAGRNFSAVRLEVKTDNDEAINLYKKFGFAITSRINAYYSDASDAFLMWRTI